MNVGTVRWIAAGFVHLRTPLLPFEEFLALGEELLVASTDDGSADARDAEARARVAARLRTWIARPIVREAIRVASRPLDAEVERWLADPARALDERLAASLYGYVARMCGRATPFGLFAGTTAGTIGAPHRLRLAPTGHHRRLSALDGRTVDALATLFLERAEDALPIQPNPTLVAIAGRLHFVARLPAADRTAFELAAVTPDAPLRAALDAATGGATPRSVRAAVAAAAPDASGPEVAAYVRQLLEQDLLQSTVAPAVTGDPALTQLHATLHRIATRRPALRAKLGALADLERAVHELDAAPLGEGTHAERAVDAQLEALEPTLTEHAVRADLMKPGGDVVLGDGVARDLLAATLVLQRLFRRRSVPGLAQFRERFTARYEQREVPLLEALDEDTGIGFDSGSDVGADPSPLLEGMPRAASWAGGAALEPALHWLLPLASDVVRRGGSELRLTDEALERWERDNRLTPPDPLPDAFAVLASLEAADDEAVRTGRHRVLHLGATTHGSAMLGRFCAGDDALASHVQAYHRAEEALRPDAIFAEVVQCPDARYATVARRPLMRSHEVPVHGRSRAERARQIALADLRVSVVGTRVRLRSVRLDREVIPRAASAFNAWGPWSVGLGRFLDALQYQDGMGVIFDWGPLAGTAALPRVVYGRVVLARAQWRVGPEWMTRLHKAEGGARRLEVAALRTALGIPRLVGLAAVGDAPLPLDLDNPLAVDLLARQSRGGVTLVEQMPAADALAVHGPEGRFVSEVVVPFLRTGAPVASAPATTRTKALRAPTTAERQVPPGGAWCYVKLYGGIGATDRLLVDGLRALVRKALARGTADAWFFLRYRDPEYHLRLRVHGDAERIRREFLPALHVASGDWLAEGRVTRVQLDTYHREVERYGGVKGIALAEQLFAADSDAVLAMLATQPDASARWQATLLGVDALFHDFGVVGAARQELIAGAEEQFAAEFNAGADQWRHIGATFRRERHALEALRTAPPPAWIVTRSARMAPVIQALRAAADAGTLTVPLAQMARDLVHLHVNRALRSSWREQEFVLYALLRRLDAARRADGAS